MAAAQKVDDVDPSSTVSWRSDVQSRQSGGGWPNEIPAKFYDKPRFGIGSSPKREAANRHVSRHSRFFPDSGTVHNSSKDSTRQQSSSGGGWAKTSNTSDLTLEEQALRESLRKEAAPASDLVRRKFVQFDGKDPIRNIQSEPGTTLRRTMAKDGMPSDYAARLRASWDCPNCGVSNFDRNRECRNCRTSRSLQATRRRRSWMCTSCEQLNAEQYEQCWNCRSERAPRDQQDESSLAPGWEHVRRSGSAPIEPSPDLPSRIERSGDLQSVAKARQIEREKLMRIEKTKDGKFVGLGGQHQSHGNDYLESSPAELAPTPESKNNHQSAFNPNSRDETESRPPFRREQRQHYWDSKTRHAHQQESQYELPRVARGFERTSAPFTKAGSRESARRNKKVYTGYDEAEEDEEERAVRKMERKERRKRTKATEKSAAPPTPIYLPEFISVSNLAGVLRVRVEDFISKMQELGFEEMNNDHVLDAETAGLVAAEFNFESIIEQTEDRDLHPLPPAADKSLLPARPPVVTIMGHVDHGKTTLLDYLRKSSVAASEHGGITQHIGAFSVPMPGGRLVTFLDTPGHEAFLSMRQRGANVTDIVILVVAADDSVKPQTIEAIKHAQAAKVPMIVAVNKIDKEDSNVERVKQDLARYNVEIEDYGGDTQVVCVSGKTGQGMEALEDAAVALADILDMRAEIDGQAEGWVLEATTRRAGRVATVLVRRGTLRSGDVIVAGTSWARVRSLRNEAGAMIESAGPGTPVEIDGWREQPLAGDEVIQAPDEQKAKDVVEYRMEATERTKLAADMEAVNEARRLEQEKREQLEKAAELAAANPDKPQDTQARPTYTAAVLQEVFFVIKADVSGSVEAVSNSVSSLGNSEVRPHILRSGVGPISEFDVDHAAVAKGHIINFSTPIEGHIRQLAEEKDVAIIDHSIIYRLVDDVKAKLSDKLPPNVTQKVLGEAEIGKVFEINTKGRVMVPVAGCRIRNGVISRTAKVRVLRDSLRDKPDVVYDGKLSLLFPSSSFTFCGGDHADI